MLMAMTWVKARLHPPSVTYSRNPAVPSSGSAQCRDAAMPSRIPSLRPRLLLLALLPALAAQRHDDLPQTQRRVAGDDHVHSRCSAGWDSSVEPPTPVMGGDATHPNPMNAVMGRRHGLDRKVTTDPGGANPARLHRGHAYPELHVSLRAVPE